MGERVKREEEKGEKEGVEEIKGKREKKKIFFFLKREEMKRRGRKRERCDGCGGERQRKSIITISVISVLLASWSIIAFTLLGVYK